jgi:hypothetical protein
MRVYRALLHLYPRRFRREYGDAMVALLEDQLRDEHAARVIGRAAVDLVTTVPASHLEAHMKRSPITVTIAVLVALGVVFAVVGGRIGLVAALAAFVVAAMTWRRSQPVAAATDGRWWKLLLGGVALFGADMLVANIVGELPEGGWFVAMVVGLTSLVLMAAGVGLGIAGRFRTSSA